MGGSEPSKAELEAEIVAIKAEIATNERSKKTSRYPSRAAALRLELDEAHAALNRVEDPGGLQRLARIEQKYKDTMERLRKASVQELEASEEAEPGRRGWGPREDPRWKHAGSAKGACRRRRRRAWREARAEPGRKPGPESCDEAACEGRGAKR